MGFETLLYDVRDGVATLTLNRAERHAALNVVMARELKHAWAEMKREPAVVCAPVPGAGERAFCTSMADGSARAE